MEAAGIAPASRDTQVVLQSNRCVERWRQRLHDVCTDVTLQELVVNWQRKKNPLRVVRRLGFEVAGFPLHA